VTLFSQKLNNVSEQIIYDGSRSVAPASLNALTEPMWAPGFNSASNSGPIGTAYPPTDPAFLSGALGVLASRGAMHPDIDAKTAVREALEAAAKMLENRAGNHVYRSAWRAAAKLVRSCKPD
jgi:hypothetical protein